MWERCREKSHRWDEKPRPDLAARLFSVATFTVVSHYDGFVLIV